MKIHKSHHIVGVLLGILCLMQIPMGAQEYRALPTDVTEPVYHLFSSKDYPCIALGKNALYKVFGKTVVKCPLPTALSLDGSESTAMIESDKDLYIAEDSGVLIINFERCGDIKIRRIMDNMQCHFIDFDNRFNMLYANKKGVFRKKQNSPPVSILSGGHTITSSAKVDANRNFLFADIDRGIYKTHGDSTKMIYKGIGVTAMDYINQDLFINKQGRIIKITGKGNEKLLTTLPSKYKSISNLYYDNDYNLWIQGDAIFAYNLTDELIHKVTFEENHTTYDITTNDGTTYIASEGGLYVFYRTLDQVVHTKTQKQLPLLYPSNKKNIIIDNGILYEVTSRTSKRVSQNTNLMYPIESTKGYWVKLADKLMKVGNKDYPPIQAPQDTISTISYVEDTFIAIGTSEGLYLQHPQRPRPDLHTIKGKYIHALLDAKSDSLTSAASNGINHTDLLTGISSEVSNDNICAARHIKIKGNDTIYVCEDKIQIISGNDSSTISSKDDLKLSKILDIEIIGDNWYILSSTQLIKGEYQQNKSGDFSDISRYLIYPIEKGLLSFQNNLLYIESPTAVTYIDPSRLTTDKLAPELTPKLTYEYGDNDLSVYDQAITGESKLRYETKDGEWAAVKNNSIPYQDLSDDGVKIQKENLFGEWIPIKVNGIKMVPRPRESKLGWILVAIGLLALIILVAMYIKSRQPARI